MWVVLLPMRAHTKVPCCPFIPTPFKPTHPSSMCSLLFPAFLSVFYCTKAQCIFRCSWKFLAFWPSLPAKVSSTFCNFGYGFVQGQTSGVYALRWGCLLSGWGGRRWQRKISLIRSTRSSKAIRNSVQLPSTWSTTETIYCPPLIFLDLVLVGQCAGIHSSVAMRVICNTTFRYSSTR